MAITGALAMFLIIFSGVNKIMPLIIAALLLIILSPMLFLGLLFALFVLIRAVWHCIRGPRE